VARIGLAYLLQLLHVSSSKTEMANTVIGW